jgi:hypothetical protein
MVDPQDWDWVIGEAALFPNGTLVMHYRVTDWVTVQAAAEIFGAKESRPAKFHWWLGNVLFLRQAWVPMPEPAGERLFPGLTERLKNE